MWSSRISRLVAPRSFASRFDRGFVEQEDLGIADDGPSHGHALALAAGELIGLLVELARQAEDLRRRQHLLMDDVRVFLAQRQGEGHVFIDGHVAVQGVVLENHRHVAILGRGLGDVLAVEQELAAGDILQSRDHAQGGGLAAAGGADQDDQLAVPDVKVEVEDRLHVVVVDFVYVLNIQFCHTFFPLLYAVRPRALRCALSCLLRLMPTTAPAKRHAAESTRYSTQRMNCGVSMTVTAFS